MEKVLALGYILVVFISCNNRTEYANNQSDNDSIKENDSKQNIEILNTSNVIPEKTIYENFEVVYLDYFNDWLQRVFVTIDTANIYNDSILQAIICEIHTHFDIDEKSNISFFSEKKYADYKDILFFIPDHLLPIEDYNNWMNYYYLAEYDFESNEYKTFPSCRKNYKRRKIIKIECE